MLDNKEFLKLLLEAEGDEETTVEDVEAVEAEATEGQKTTDSTEGNSTESTEENSTETEDSTEEESQAENEEKPDENITVKPAEQDSEDSKENSFTNEDVEKVQTAFLNELIVNFSKMKTKTKDGKTIASEISFTPGDPSRIKVDGNKGRFSIIISRMGSKETFGSKLGNALQNINTKGKSYTSTGTTAW